LIASVIAGGDLPGLSGDDYHLELGLNPREAANRAWTVLRGAWATYREALASLPAGQSTTGLTRERWLLVLMRWLDFGRVPTTPAGGLSVDDRSFPVSHLAGGSLPVHLLGWGTKLDHRTPGMAGAADQAPQAMVQRLLNSSNAYRWALLSNGSTLRLLRDSTSLVGPSYVEFDLAGIFDGDLFSDFVALYLICHQSRFEVLDPETEGATCWLERWREHAVETGARAKGALRVGVHDAIEALGTGFVTHPKNSALRDDLDSEKLSRADFLHGLLRVVYRVLFCFVAEDRGLLLDPEASAEARARYQQWFSTSRLRRIATRRAGDNHSDQWQLLQLVLGSLGKEEGCPTLGIVGLGGIFEPGKVDLDPGLAISNRYLLAAVRHLCVTRPDVNGPRRMVNYRNLGAEELGGIYEGLLGYTPQYDNATRSFSLKSLAGSDRKTSGSYYTPSSLVEELLDSALDQLLDEAEGKLDPEAALLALSVCDPSCGSAHFLVAAGRRIARRVANIRANGAEPTIDQIHDAMYDVVSRCLYGVDVTPLAAELAKVSLWMEGMSAGRPLSVLDAHIKTGNSLLGTTPALLADGIPDEAFTPIEGDDKRVASVLKRRNRAERTGARQIGEEADVPFLPADFIKVAAQIEAYVPKSLADAHVAARRLRELDSSPEARRARLVADAWCSAFVVPKIADGPNLTQSELRAIAAGKGSAGTLHAVEEVSAQYRWFHWHLEFPTVFRVGGSDVDSTTGWSGGFDCVIGNPPWEHVELKEQEWFASRVPAIAEAPNASARKGLVAVLREDHPELHAEFITALRQADGERSFLSNSGRYPLCGRGRVNTYAVFAEADRSLLTPTGRLGVVLPTGIATDHTTRAFFGALSGGRELVSLYDFENKGIFPDVDSRVKFCLLTLSGRQRPEEAGGELAFFCHSISDLDDPGRRFRLSPEEIELLNPNTRTCPVFRSQRDAKITISVYKRVPVMMREGDSNGNPWNITFRQGLFNMASDAGLFCTRTELEGEGFRLSGNIFRKGAETYIPLYEGKMAHHFDHRWASNEDGGFEDLSLPSKQDPMTLAFPRYWIDEREVEAQVGNWHHDWLLGYRGIAPATNERTVIASVIPLNGVGHSYFLIMPRTDPGHIACLGASLTSFALDFAARQKVGGSNINFFLVEQFPVLPPATYDQPTPWDRNHATKKWLLPRVLELTYTAWDLAGFAVDLGYEGPPFRWYPERRFVMRAELDAAFFHLYGIDRDDVEYIMETFPIVKKHDEEHFDEYRTKRLVLEAYDAMANAIETGEPLVSTLDPPPGKGPRHPDRGTPPARDETGRDEPSSRATSCGHNPDPGGGTAHCQVCAFNDRRTS